MSVMNRVNKKARGAAANSMMGMMPQMFPGGMMPQMMQMGLPMGQMEPVMGMMQPGQDDHDSDSLTKKLLLCQCPRPMLPLHRLMYCLM